MYKTIYFTLTLVLIILTTNSFAGKPSILNAGLPLNSLVPEITAVDTNKHPQTIKQLSGEKGLILILFRSADWCPYCKKHLVEINEWHSKFIKLGYGLAAISYDSVEILKIFSDMKKLQYPLLSDQNYKTFIDFKILNKKYQLGDDDYGIPYPGVMIINPDGTLEYKYFYKGYKKRVRMKKLYKALSVK